MYILIFFSNYWSGQWLWLMNNAVFNVNHIFYTIVFIKKETLRNGQLKYFFVTCKVYLVIANIIINLTTRL